MKGTFIQMKKALTMILAGLMLLGCASCASNRTTVTPSDKENAPIGVAPGPDGNYSNVPAVTNPALTGDALPDNGNSGNDTTATVTDAPTDEEIIESIGGWWKHIGGSHLEYIPFVEMMYVDSDTKTWIEYGKNGIKGGTYPLEIGEYGIYFLYGDVGTTILNFDGVSLLNMSGLIEYIPADPVTEIAPDAFNGSWYLYGDKTAEHIVISDDNIRLYSDILSEGTFTRGNIDATLYDGSTSSRLSLTASYGTKYFVTEVGDVLYDPTTNKAYIRDKMLETPEGEDFIKKYDLICNDWNVTGENGAVVRFDYFENKILKVKGDNTEVIGTWGIHEFELCLHYSDGHEEITPYDAEYGLMFSYLDHMELIKAEK